MRECWVGGPWEGSWGRCGCEGVLVMLFLTVEHLSYFREVNERGKCLRMLCLCACVCAHTVYVCICGMHVVCMCARVCLSVCLSVCVCVHWTIAGAYRYVQPVRLLTSRLTTHFASRLQDQLDPDRQSYSLPDGSLIQVSQTENGFS